MMAGVILRNYKNDLFDADKAVSDITIKTFRQFVTLEDLIKFNN